MDGFFALPDGIFETENFVNFTIAVFLLLSSFETLLRITVQPQCADSANMQR